MFLSRPLLLWLNRRIARSIRRPISAHDQWPSLVLGTCQKRKLRPSVTRWQAAGQSRVPWPSLPLAPGSFSSSRWGWPPTVAQTALSSPRHSPSWLPRPEATGTRPGNPWSPLKKRGEGEAVHDPLVSRAPRPLEIPRATELRHQSATLPTRLQSMLGVAVRGWSAAKNALIAQVPGSGNTSVRTCVVKKLTGGFGTVPLLNECLLNFRKRQPRIKPYPGLVKPFQV